jgi:hypothetical protein
LDKQAVRYRKIKSKPDDRSKQRGTGKDFKHAHRHLTGQLLKIDSREPPAEKSSST